MGLWNIQTVAPCMSYVDFGSCVPPPGPALWGPLGLTYNGQLITCPKHYRQTTNWVSNFFYEPENDRLIAHIVLTTTAWPSWDVRRYEFDAATGVQVGDSVFIGIWGAAYTRAATMGSFNKIYACRNSEYYIREISWQYAEPVTGGWGVNPYTWNPQSLYGYAVVNRVDDLLAAASNWTLDCWRTISTTPGRFAQLRLPNVISYLAYESRNYCWVITVDGVILKADYQIPRWEMISTVQNPETDTVKYFITFDTKRHRVVVFRQRSDAADGACQHQLEFYSPMVKAAQLTQPVPVTTLRTGNRIILAANLIGDAGEGVTPYTVNGSMAVPVEGRLATPFSGTGLNGQVCFQYQAPDDACTETLQLAVTVEES